MLDDEQYLGTFVMGKSTVVDVGCTQMIRKEGVFSGIHRDIGPAQTLFP